jgi:RNA polymerase sigma-70 factor (ECF subfamily)
MDGMLCGLTTSRTLLPGQSNGSERIENRWRRTVSLERGQSELVQRARRGDGEAFAELLRPEYRTAVRLAKALLHNIDEAEDAVQEAAFKAWRRLDNLHEGSLLRPWFLAIVANQCRSVRRAKWWSSRTDQEAPEEADEAGDIVGSIDLRRAVALLDYDQRLVLVLRYYMDMPFEEIALTLEISPKAARSRVERAVKNLRPMLRVQEAVS